MSFRLKNSRFMQPISNIHNDGIWLHRNLCLGFVLISFVAAIHNIHRELCGWPFNNANGVIMLIFEHAN